MTDYTPGPWKVIVAGNMWGAVPVNRAGRPRDGRETEDVAEGSTHSERWRADSALIAAATDLYESLAEIRAAYDANDTAGIREGIERSRKALAKARHPTAQP